MLKFGRIFFFKFRKISPNYSTQKKIPKFPLNFFVEKKGEISQGKKKKHWRGGKTIRLLQVLEMLLERVWFTLAK